MNELWFKNHNLSIRSDAGLFRKKRPPRQNPSKENPEGFKSWCPGPESNPPQNLAAFACYFFWIQSN
jgi:hypothetical protein